MILSNLSRHALVLNIKISVSDHRINLFNKFTIQRISDIDALSNFLSYPKFNYVVF